VTDATHVPGIIIIIAVDVDVVVVVVFQMFHRKSILMFS